MRNRCLASVIYKAGGDLNSSVAVSSDWASLTVNTNYIQPMPDHLVWNDNNDRNHTVNQLKSLINFVMRNFEVLNEEQRLSQSFSLVSVLYIGSMLYQTLFVSVTGSSAYAIWKSEDFILCVRDYIEGKRFAPDCTAAQLQLLRACFIWHRTFFVTYLPPSFSLAEDCLLDLVLPTMIRFHDPLTVAWLEKVKYQRLGCSSHREDFEEGDTITIIPGCRLPLILRPLARAEDGTPRFKIVGEAYVFGIMNGEAIEKLPQQSI